ncbi:MAG: MgtC/SapB family protein [Clostridiales bacterium]|nr:MgtC/SapB family protein [Clostridiales bacterium]
MFFRELIQSIIESESFRFSFEALLRLTLAGVFGGIIGFEREHSHRPAGFRTHILVAVGSALVMLTSSYIFIEYQGLTNMDPARLGAQVISGIGFLGAGTILREGFSVKGLTTAASLWAVSCIGLAVGIGYYEGAFIATIFIYITLNFLKRIMIRSNKGNTVNIIVKEIDAASKKITRIVQDCDAIVQRMEIEYPEKNESMLSKNKDKVVLKAYIIAQNDRLFRSITEDILALEEVEEIYVD